MAKSFHTDNDNCHRTDLGSVMFQVCILLERAELGFAWSPKMCLHCFWELEKVLVINVGAFPGDPANGRCLQGLLGLQGLASPPLERVP